MAAQKGRDCLLYAGVSPGGTVVAAAKTLGFKVNGQAVDVSTKDSAGWTELGADFGKKSVTIDISGVLQGAATAETLLTKSLSATIDDYYLNFNGGDRISGKFMVQNYNGDSGDDDAQTFSATLVSSGPVVYTNT